MHLCGVIPGGSPHSETPPTTRRGGAHDSGGVACQARTRIPSHHWGTGAQDGKTGSGLVTRRKPTKDRVEAWIKKQGWKMTTASITEKVVKNWAPSGCEDQIMDRMQIQDLVQTQHWRGLHMKTFEGKRREIITTC